MNQVVTRTCEVCGEDFELEQIFVEETLCEMHGKCACGMYSYDYAYGAYVVFVDGEGFTWHQCLSEEAKLNVKTKVKKAAAKARVKKG